MSDGVTCENERAGLSAVCVCSTGRRGEGGGVRLLESNIDVNEMKM